MIFKKGGGDITKQLPTHGLHKNSSIICQRQAREPNREGTAVHRKVSYKEVQGCRLLVAVPARDKRKVTKIPEREIGENN